jgi:hypothetical protein
MVKANCCDAQVFDSASRRSEPASKLLPALCLINNCKRLLSSRDLFFGSITRNHGGYERIIPSFENCFALRLVGASFPLRMNIQLAVCAKGHQRTKDHSGSPRMTLNQWTASVFVHINIHIYHFLIISISIPPRRHHLPLYPMNPVQPSFSL